MVILLNNNVKDEIKKLFKEITDDWLLQVNYYIEVGSMNPTTAEKEALERYRKWTKQLEKLLEDN
jgi:uncharacterized protein YjbK